MIYTEKGNSVVYEIIPPYLFHPHPHTHTHTHTEELKVEWGSIFSEWVLDVLAVFRFEVCIHMRDDINPRTLPMGLI